MCNLAKLNDTAYVAEIKLPYIKNIINQAKACQNIDKIMLFGSATGTECRDDSDIDIAVFGDATKASYLKSKEFRSFHENLFSFGDDYVQDYDILYFNNNKTYNDAIMNDIDNGVEIYNRRTTI